MHTTQIPRLFILCFLLFTCACSSSSYQNVSFLTPTSMKEIKTTPFATEGKVLEKILICNSFTSATSVPLWYAYENRLFEKYGLDVEITDAENGSKAAIAMISGEFPICQVAGSPISNAVIAGEDLVYIAEYYDVFLFSLMVAQEIQHPEDLRGKVVAITQAGSAQDTAMRLALKSLGLEPDKDVAIVSTGGDAERLAAMDAGQVAGALFSPPTTLTVREKGYHVLLDLSTLGTNYSRQGLATSRRYLQANRARVLNFVKAIIEGINLMKKDPVGTKQVLAKYLELDILTDDELLQEAYDIIVLDYLREEPYPTIKGIETVLYELTSQNPDASTVKPEDIIDGSIMREIEESGFLEKLNSIP
jgi:NitT/TauT family transport system substrate-binding protein